MRSVFRIRLAVLLVLGALALFGCGGSGVATEPAEQAPASSAAPEAAESDVEEAVESEPTVESEPAVVDTPAGAAALPEELQGVLASASGEQIDLATLRGQDVVLWFWAPW